MEAAPVGERLEDPLENVSGGGDFLISGLLTGESSAEARKCERQK